VVIWLVVKFIVLAATKNEKDGIKFKNFMNDIIYVHLIRFRNLLHFLLFF
jgi:hypothetical protein